MRSVRVGFNAAAKEETTMPMLQVRTKKGRRAYYENRPIPSDKFVAVPDCPYIRRLIDHWGDLEVQGGDHGSKERHHHKRESAQVQQ